MRNVFSFCSLIVVLFGCFLPGLPAEAYEVNNLTKLTNGPIQESEPVFNADGTKIAYRYLHPPYSWANCDIWVMNIDGSGKAQITTDSRGEFSPRFAPDGRITYNKEFGSNDYDLWIVNADGSSPHLLIGGSYRQTLCRWHPAGNEIVYSSEYQLGGPLEIWTANSDGSGKLRLTDHTVDGYGQNSPVYSRSGNLIAYANYANSSASTDIWVMNSDGSGKHQIIFDASGQNPMFWWPDDSRIGYVQDGDLWLHNLSTSTDELLLSMGGGSFDWCDLSPDGTKLVFDWADASGQHIWIGDVTGSNLPPVATDDFVTTAMNTYVEFYILDNDFDPDGDPYAITSVDSPTYGILLWCDPDGQCAYLPDEGFVGTDSFEYEISDGSLSATATVTITVIEPATIKGTVKDADTDKKIPDVLIVADGRWTHTDSKGRYELTGLTPGEITVKASKTGYEPKEQTVTLGPGEKREVNLLLKPARLRLIIDTDPAMGDSDPDDITALIYAFGYASEHSDCEIEGITYGYGNFGDQILDADGTPGGEQMLNYYLLQINKMLEVLREGGVIDSYPDVRRGHKMSETWQNAGEPVPNGATEFMIEKVGDNPGQITIVALGTLTNVATAMANYKKNDPNSPQKFLQDCRDVWIIGGAIDCLGNVIDCDTGGCSLLWAEWNIWRDRVAAEYVFSHTVRPGGFPKIKIVPLNATFRYGVVENSHINNLPKTRVGDYLRFPLHWWIRQENIFDQRQLDPAEYEDEKIAFARIANVIGGGFPPYDTIGLALVIEPSLAIATQIKSHKVFVDTFTGSTGVNDDLSDREKVDIFYDFYNEMDQMTERIIYQWGKSDQASSQNSQYFDCSEADYVVKYWEFGDQYAGPEDVFSMDPYSYGHLPVGVAIYTGDIWVDVKAEYRGRLFFDVPSFDGEVDNVKLHIYCDTKSQEPLTFLPYLNHKVEIFGCDAYSNSAIDIWNSADNKQRYAGPTTIGTLQAWRTVDLGKDAAVDLQNAKGGRFAILLAEQDDDTNCAWFDTSVDWKAYLECEF